MKRQTRVSMAGWS